MAIIVNKEEKRRNIALSCRELLLKNGIADLTISQIAKQAGVGKGTIYEYFDNKEDIVFEIITTFIVEYEQRLEFLSESSVSTREKLFHFFNLLFENEVAKKHLLVYKEFLAISLLHNNKEMLDFSMVCRVKFNDILTKILEKGVASGEISATANLSVSSLMFFSTGLVVDSRLSMIDVEKEINLLLDMLLQGA
jgi:AcrR family transcriptional regulator